MARHIIKRAQQLKVRRMEVDIHWVSGHMGVEGNEKGNEVAKEATEKAGIRTCPEMFISLAHVGLTISERNWMEAKQWFRTENDRRPPLQRSRYDSALEI